MYRLSHQGKRTDSFREAITSALASPLRRLRQIRGTDETMEEFWALKDVSFDVQPGEVVGIIGRNGAGKSTMLKILSRIVEPTEGEIRLRGRVASLLEVGTGFHPELTGRENIYLNGSILGMKKREIDRKFDEIVDFAEVEKFLDTPVKRYSSGMYVRLAFAVAAHLDPEILIVDEVLAVGDAEFQKKCLGKMKEVTTGTGRTVLFVSHNMAAVRSLCNRAVFIKGGSVFDDGPAAKVAGFYSSTFGSDNLESEIKLRKPSNASQWIDSIALVVDGKPSTTIPMDSIFELRVRILSNFPTGSPKILVIIGNENGDRLIQVSNRFCETVNALPLSSSSELNITFGRLPLSGGRYTLSLLLGEIGSLTHMAFDAATFNVEPRDIFGTGRIPNKVDAPVWFEAKFNCDSILPVLPKASF